LNHCVIIPSCKKEEALNELAGEILLVDHDLSVLYSYSDLSAAVNRNAVLDIANKEYHPQYIVMIDDDITGFFPGWANLLVEPLENQDILYVSARLLNECGKPQMVMGFSNNVNNAHVEVTIAPSAAIAFRNDGTRFCEEYQGSGFEDTDFHFQLKEKYGYDKKVIINNLVKLTHLHEMKNQNGVGEGFNPFEENKKIFDRRWPGKRRLLGL
jgi:glycosyltransferase involved in cell wall biosynthesis